MANMAYRNACSLLTSSIVFAYIGVIGTNFGLINQIYNEVKPVDKTGKPLSQWQQFAAALMNLNQRCDVGVNYKLLFLGRHGEGYHNAAETFYGTPAWNCYWAELNGNAATSWNDAKVTNNGITQAQKAHDLLARLIKDQGIQTPHYFYTSQLSRCLATVNITFAGLDLPKHKPFLPIVKEYLLEGISLHTCDQLNSKSYIQKNYPEYKIEPNFIEEDNLWNGVTGETSDAQDLRSKAALDSIFSHNSGSVISITSHSGEIASLLRVLGYRVFSLATGAVIPVLVKAGKLKGSLTTTAATWTPSPHCTVPPLSSISGNACVCPSSAAPVTSLLVTGSLKVSPTITFKPTRL